MAFKYNDEKLTAFFEILLKRFPFIRKNSNIRYFQYCFIKQGIFRRKIKSELLYREIKKSGFILLRNCDLKKKVLNRCINPSEKVCHIIGSGWSLNKSQSIIKKDDFVIGFNQAALSGIEFDLYFVEFGGEKVDEIARKQINLVDDIIKDQTDLIIFKNLYEDKNSLNYVKRNWGNRVSYIKDVIVPCFDRKEYFQIKMAIRFLLKDDAYYMRQFGTTVGTSIACAKYYGFKKIVLHGVDFGGEYFFDSPDFKGLKHYRPKPQSGSRFYKKLKKDDFHPSSSMGLGARTHLKIIKQKLDKERIKLYTASTLSPSSEILPVFLDA